MTGSSRHTVTGGELSPVTTTAPRPAAWGLLVALLLAATTLATMGLTATPAAAHASLTGSSPEDGEVVAAAPRSVTLTFSEPVALSPDAVRVLAPDGSRVDTGQARESGTASYAVPLTEDTTEGTYTVVWQVVSTDSHPVSGAFTFSVGAPSATSVELPDHRAGEGPVATLYDIARYGAYAGFLLLVGTPAFTLLCWPAAAGLRNVRRLALAGWKTLVATTLALLLLRVPYTGSGRLGDVLDIARVWDVAGTKAGIALVSRLLLLVAAGLFLAVLFGPYARLRTLPRDTYRDRDRDSDRDGDDDGDGDSGTAGAGDVDRPRRLTVALSLAGTLLAAGLAATWSAAEHASAGPQAGVAIPADLVHLLAVAAWLGGLATLLTLLHDADAADLPAVAVRRYSALAFSAVVALAGTGLYQSWRQVGSWPALTGTAYGRLLLVKVALVALLVTVAWFARRRLGHLTDQPAPVHTSPPVPAPEPEPALPVDPLRARQLALQRAAVAEARRRMARDADPHRIRLRRAVRAETAVAAVLLAVTTVLTGTTPARDDAAASRAQPRPMSLIFPLALPFDTGLSSTGDVGATDSRSRSGTARVILFPARVGANSVRIRVLGPDGAPAAAEEVRVAFTLPTEDLGPLRYPAAPAGRGNWTATGIQLPRPGAWQLSLTVRTSAIDQVTETHPVTVE